MISLRSTGYKSLFILALLSGIFPGTVYATSQSVAILPFLVSGTQPQNLPDKDKLPGLLQEASLYIFQNVRRYPVISDDITNLALYRAGFKESMLLSNLVASKICIETRASFLITGEAHFSTGGTVHFSVSSYSCKAGRNIENARSSGNINKLQSILRKAIIQSTSFAPPVDYQVSRKSQGSVPDIAFVIDASGSVAGELKNLRKIISNQIRRLPLNSRVGGIVLQSGKIHTSPMGNGDKFISYLNHINAQGKISSIDLTNALHELEQYRGWHSNSRIAIIYDGTIDRDSTRYIEQRLRKLRNKGIQVSFFPLSSVSQNTLSELKRFQRTTGIWLPDIHYGKRAGFLEGFSLFFVRSGNNFYIANRDLTRVIPSGSLNLNELEPIDMVQFDNNYLTLDSLPEKYARNKNLHLTAVGPIVTDFEYNLNQALDVSDSPANYKALVKNGSVSFWIDIENKTDALTLSRAINQTMYIGLRFNGSRSSTQMIKNIPDTVRPVSQKDVPRLFINTMNHLTNVNASLIDSNDIWFLLVTVKDVIDARGNRDIRQ